MITIFRKQKCYQTFIVHPFNIELLHKVSDHRTQLSTSKFFKYVTNDDAILGSILFSLIF